MAPSIEDIERSIGREVKEGDVLIDHGGNALEVTKSHSISPRHTALKTSVGAILFEGNALRDLDLFESIEKAEDKTNKPIQERADGTHKQSKLLKDMKFFFKIHKI